MGDGATWIENQVIDKFGSQASFLVDFYHICEYLTEAAKTCAPAESKAWREKQKKRLKNNDYSTVLENLKPHVEADEIAETHAKVRACYRYLNNRTDSWTTKVP